MGIYGMKKVGATAGLLLLASCIRPIDSETPRGPSAGAPERPSGGAGSLEDLRDNPIPASAAEPAWRDLARHTNAAAPARVTHPGPSRDGTRLSYASTEFGPRPQVVVRDAYGAAPVQVTQNGADNLFP